MDSGYGQKDNNNRIAETKALPKTSPNALNVVDSTESEKWRAELAKVMTPKWLDEKVRDWAEDEDSDANLSLTRSKDR